MDYSLLVEAYQRIDSTTKRLEITDHLVDLFKKTPVELVDKVVYLTQGKLYPDYMGIELGIAEKLAVKAVAMAAGVSEPKVDRTVKELGDLGETAAKFMGKRAQATLFQEALTVEKVYDGLDRIARATGEGAQDLKIKILSGLLSNASPDEAKYLVRTVTGRLRLGVADMTILDALAIAFCGSKDLRPMLERAYNLSSDLGGVAKAVAERGVEGVKGFQVTVGKPIRPMLAERLPSAEEILAKIGGKGLAEYKYDGERLQIHKLANGEVMIFSRRLENITHHYPDVCELARKHVKADEVILEAEGVAINPDSGEMLPFQELMHRRRKYGIEEAMEQYPIALFCFDLLYADGEDYTLKPLPQRRRKLEKAIKRSERVQLSQAMVASSVEELEKFFEKAIEDGCEGVVVKSMGSDSVYQAGARGWLWIKYKRDYKSVLTDTVDLVAVGAFHGRGKRAGTYGALLMAAYDKKSDLFKTVCKVGTGFTDEDLAKLPKLFKDNVIPHRHARVESQLEADVWFVPAVVLEIVGAEITLSPIHTCAMNRIRAGSGLAIRFPRFTGRYRTDKAPEDATTVEEIVEMYLRQLKKIEAEA
ncbi:MAG: ATP-dependent DNA ligase [Candidatus Hecatellales archaeon B24]|nr:MAG: ATP-dependent DNA ligase [Candidatus Hecatellales archaeon B24]